MAKKDPVNAVQEQVKEGETLALTLCDELKKIPGKRLTIERKRQPLEEKKEAPIMAAGRRCHTFHDKFGFCEYINRYGTQGAIVVAGDPQRLEVCAVLNEESPEQVEEIRYKPHETIELQNLKSERGRLLTPKEFSKTLRRLLPFITSPDQRDIKLLARSINVAKDVELFSGSGTKGMTGQLIKVHAKSGGDKPVDVPEVIGIKFKPYVDSDELIALDLHIDLHLKEKDVYFTFEASESSQIFQNYLAAILPWMRDLLKEMDAIVTVGCLERSRWKRIS